MTRTPSSQPLLKCSLELLKHGAKHAPALEAHKSSMTDALVRGWRASVITFVAALSRFLP